MTTKTQRKATVNLDGSVNVKVTDTRTTEEKLTKLSFAEKLELMYPTPNADKITKDWVTYDNHKFYN